MRSTKKVTRRHLLAAGGSMLVASGMSPNARAQQPQWTYKYANNLPEAHPMNVRAREMAAAIKQETNGRFDLQIFPSSQLGSDTDTLSQIRSGGVEFFTLSVLFSRLWFRPPRSTAWASLSRITTGLEGDGRRSRRLYPRSNRQSKPDRHGEDL